MKKLNSSDQDQDQNQKIVEVEDFNKIRYEICKLLDSNKSEDIVLLNLKPQFNYEFWFIIATALSTSHLKKLCQDIIFTLRKRGIHSTYVPNEMDYESGWVALDYGELIVHAFLRDTRKFYDLEDLWKKAILENYP